MPRSEDLSTMAPLLVSSLHQPHMSTMANLDQYVSYLCIKILPDFCWIAFTIQLERDVSIAGKCSPFMVLEKLGRPSLGDVGVRLLPIGVVLEGLKLRIEFSYSIDGNVCIENGILRPVLLPLTLARTSAITRTVVDSMMWNLNIWLGLVALQHLYS